MCVGMYVQASVGGVDLSLHRKLCLVLCPYHHFPYLWVSFLVLSLLVGLIHLICLYSWLLWCWKTCQLYNNEGFLREMHKILI